MANLIRREQYLEQLEYWKDKEIIKVVTGVRRCGKSTLFTLFIDHLKETGVADEQIISINLENENDAALLTHSALHEHVKSRLCADKTTYVFIDEIQNCAEYERAVSSLFLNKNVDIYITGSNAYMLSGELATKLTGRYIEISMLPLSFAEFSQAVSKEPATSNKEPATVNKEPATVSKEPATSNLPDKRERFRAYARFGGFPFAATLTENPGAHAQYLEGIYNTVLIKDVVTRHGITDVSVLDAIVKFLCGNIGSPVSVKKIADTLKSHGRPIGVNTVENYIRALTDSYLFYKVERYDIRGKMHLKTAPKYYICDIGLKNATLSNPTADFGSQLENIVYLELLRRGYRVNIGKERNKEVDFVCVRNSETVYVQVTYLLATPETVEREFSALEAIDDNYPKFVVSADEVDFSRNGIRHLNIADFCFFLWEDRSQKPKILINKT